MGAVARLEYGDGPDGVRPSGPTRKAHGEGRRVLLRMKQTASAVGSQSDLGAANFPLKRAGPGRRFQGADGRANLSQGAQCPSDQGVIALGNGVARLPARALRQIQPSLGH